MANEVVVKDAAVRKFLGKLQKQALEVRDKRPAYIGLLSAIIFRDLIEHFQDEKGPAGKWRPWSPRYAEQARKRGQRKILQKTGRLRGGWSTIGSLQSGREPPRIRKTSLGILWYNPVQYAAKHDRGLGNMPKRQFAWVSSKALKEIERQTLMFMGVK